MSTTDVSIAFKASDKLSDSIRNMQKNVKGLSRDIGEYKKISEQAFDKRKEVKLNITKAKTELKELEKAVKQGDEKAQESFKKKQNQLDLLQEEYRRLGRVIKDAGNAEKSLADDISRNSNKYSSRSAPDLVRSLKNAGLGVMVGNSISGYLGQMVTSSLGSNTGSFVKNIVGGAVTGGAMGSLGGPIGTAIGTAVGGVAGAINGFTEKNQKKDDIFRDEVQKIYNDVQQRKVLNNQQGIDAFINREKQIAGLKTLLGDEIKSKSLFSQINKFGINTPYQTNSMINSAKQMLAYGIKSDDLMKNIKMLGEVAMGDQQKFDSLSYAYAQIQSAGRLTGQDLLQLTSAGFNPLKILAEEQGKTLKEMRDIMSKGLISAEDVTHAFEKATGKGGSFYGAMSEIMKQYGGKEAKLNDIKKEINIGYGEGFTNEHIKGIDYEISQYTGPNGDKFKNIQKHIGAYEASLKNKETEIYFDTFNELFASEKYKKLEKIVAFAGAFDTKQGAFEARQAGITEKMVENAQLELDEMYFLAQSEAKAKWLDSPEHKKQLKASLKTIESLNDLVRVNSEYIRLIEDYKNELSKGYDGIPKRKTGEINIRNRVGYTFTNNKTDEKTGNGHATGLNRVPYDDYLAKLHEGERVLTRLQADEMDRKVNRPPVNITINVNGAKSDPYEIAQVICSEVKNAMENLVDNS